MKTETILNCKYVPLSNIRNQKIETIINGN